MIQNEKTQNDLMEKLVSLCKRRGFVFPGSEIYGGLANSWDYGPLGVELKNNIKKLWWKKFVQQREDMVGIDAALMMNPKVWGASGHLATFTDPLVECKTCHNRFRIDHLPEVQQSDFDAVRKEIMIVVGENFKDIDASHKKAQKLLDARDITFGEGKKQLNAEELAGLEAAYAPIIALAKKHVEEASEIIDFNSYTISEIDKSRKFSGLVTKIYLNRFIHCPICKSMNWDTPKDFNLMFKTFIGPTEDESSTVYFRPETAQAIFVDFQNTLETTRQRIPFGIAQIGKAFRNEITPGNFIFRTREFEQMEIEYFVKPTEWEKHFEQWLEQMKSWMHDIGIAENKLHFIEIPEADRAHYSKRTIDVEFDYPFGQKELYGLAYRGDFDLKSHQEKSKQDLEYRDPETNEKYLPHVIEPSFGVDRTVLAVLLSAYTEIEGGRTTTTESNKEAEVVLRLDRKIAPIKIAVLPLSKKEELSGPARELANKLRNRWMVMYDESQSIGKRYRRQDEIGTPYCVTMDFDSLEDKKVTVRDRDTMAQERIAIDELENYFKEKLDF